MRNRCPSRWQSTRIPWQNKPQQPIWINHFQRIIVAVGIPVVACFRRIGGDEASDAGVVVAVAEQLQPAVIVRLVLTFAHETERRRRGACSADDHSEAVVEHAVRDRLAAVCYAPRAAKGVAVVELARRAAPLAEAGSVDRRAVLEHRARRRRAVAEIVGSSGAVHPKWKLYTGLDTVT